MPVMTKADALAVVDLVARTEGDTELVEHLLTALRSFLLGRVLINRQPNADLDAPPNVRYWG